MQTHATAAAASAELAEYFEQPSNYAHADAVADLVLERLPNGEHAWLGNVLNRQSRTTRCTGQQKLAVTRSLDCELKRRCSAVRGQPWLRPSNWREGMTQVPESNEVRRERLARAMK